MVFLITFLLFIIPFNVLAIAPDTLRSVQLQEVDVIVSVKENGLMRQQPTSVTLIGEHQMNDHHITSLKGASQMVPNLFIPDYGSRLTSAVYIRGIGSRINTPAVGLYVDNIPYVDKSAFDFNFYDIERVDVLRGPQGTLYGRNTMGGLVRIYTKNPFHYKGTDVRLSYATGDNHRNASLSHYHRISEQLAFVAGGYYEGGDGFFKNSTTGDNADAMQAGGGRIRAIYKPTEKLSFDLSANYDYTDEGAYPYFYTGSLTEGPEPFAEEIGKITNNRKSSYRRGLFNTGLNIEYKASRFIMNAITGYQYLNDRMQLDQDFIAQDIYTLEQQQRINTLSEEVTFKSQDHDGWYHWLTGASLMNQNLHTDGPVTFYEDGVSGIVEGNINGIFKSLQSENPRMPSMGLSLKEREFVVSSKMKTPTLDLALFHNSTFTWNNWKLTAGLRLEYEHLRLKYYSNSDITFDFNIQMSPAMGFNYPGLKASPLFDGEMDKDYLQVLPKFSLMYEFENQNNIYASVSKGHRSGGYNVQMFSDLVQDEMRTQMIGQIDEAGKGVVKKMLGEDTYNSLTTKGDVSAVIYKPEYSWNYEVGTHLSKPEVQMDAALFYNRIFDQQIARFAPSGFGRMMVNAGKSETYGGEFSVRWTPVRQLAIGANYGYTHAKFIDYDDGQGNDYTGKYVPFVPMHTMNIDAAYTWYFKANESSSSKPQSLTLGADFAGAGDLYWTENNAVKQSFYGLLNARLSLKADHYSLTFWGKNLTDHEYNTFYFESARRGFEQHGKPLQIGVDLSLHF